MTPRLPLPRLFFASTPQPCPYLPNRMERKVLADLSVPEADRLHSHLSRAGFRRSHTLAYAPLCAGCSACIPIRLPVAAFQPDRTQRRVWRRNADLEATLCPPAATAEQYALFRLYLDNRHADGDMAGMNEQDYAVMLEDTPVDTRVIEFRDQAGTLVAVSLIDVLEDGLSAVYSFYRPDMPHRSLGCHVILFLARQTILLGKPYLYLGYWVPGSPKMAYKSRYRPAEILRAGQWQTLNPDEPVETGREDLFPDAPLF